MPRSGRGPGLRRAKSARLHPGYERSSSRRQRLGGLRRREHLAGVVPDAGQLDQAPVEGGAVRLRRRLSGLEGVQAALMARRALGTRLRRVVLLIILIVGLAEINRQRLLQVAAQGVFAL